MVTTTNNYDGYYSTADHDHDDGITVMTIISNHIKFSHFDRSLSLDYVSFRFWVGMWTALILLVMVAFDLSYLVCYITRFTGKYRVCHGS